MTTSNISENISETAAADPLTERVRATWTAGDFGRIAKGYERGAGEFIARLNLDVGERVLDVATGTGNLALPAARGGAFVTGVDIAPNLISQARLNAEQEGLEITFDVGDAEQLGYADKTFDTAVLFFLLHELPAASRRATARRHLGSQRPCRHPLSAAIFPL